MEKQNQRTNSFEVSPSMSSRWRANCAKAIDRVSGRSDLELGIQALLGTGSTGRRRESSGTRRDGAPSCGCCSTFRTVSNTLAVTRIGVARPVTKFRRLCRRGAGEARSANDQRKLCLAVAYHRPDQRICGPPWVACGVGRLGLFGPAWAKFGLEWSRAVAPA